MDPVIHLLHACEVGDLGTVKEMIEIQRVDINVTFYFCPHNNSNRELLDATPLFIAARNSHFEVCEYLVGIGANVNYLTTVKSKLASGESMVTKLSPFHEVIKPSSAHCDPKCLEGKATIEFLMANGVDLSILPVKDGISHPIWTLSSKEDVALAMLLIDLGLISPSLPWCPKLGHTVLHHWASGTQDVVPVFKKLLEKGADVNALNKFGLTPLNVAAIGSSPGNPNMSILRYFLDERDDIDLSDKIQALELAGASILLFKEDQDSIDRAFHLWYEAQELRDNAEEPIIPKASLLNADKTVHWRSVEWATRDELDLLQLRPQAAIKMQAFLVTRRFLVRISSSGLMMHYLWGEFVIKHFSLSSLYRENRFTELLEISWLMLEGTSNYQEPDRQECWKMVVEVNYWLGKTLAKLKRQHNSILNLETLKLSLKLVFDSNNRSPYLSSVSINQWGTAKVIEPMQMLFNLMYTVVSEIPEMITAEIKTILMQFVKQDARNRNGYNLLLLTCLHNPISGGTLSIVRLLLEVGADPNAKIRKGFSPLHFAARFMGKGEMNSPLADLLLEYGAHLDHTDMRQQTPLDVWREMNAGEEGGVISPPAWLNPVLSLKCYCARAIQRSNTPCEEEQLPLKSLRDFVAEH